MPWPRRQSRPQSEVSRNGCPVLSGFGVRVPDGAPNTRSDDRRPFAAGGYVSVTSRLEHASTCHRDKAGRLSSGPLLRMRSWSRVRSALLDFTDRRPQIWQGIDPGLYAVYQVGDSYADIHGGSKMPGMAIWAKEHYDWSSPDVITWTVRVFAPGSHVSAAILPRGDGGSLIHVLCNRTPTSIAGRLATMLIVATRGTPVSAPIRNALPKLEATGSKFQLGNPTALVLKPRPSASRRPCVSFHGYFAQRS